MSYLSLRVTRKLLPLLVIASSCGEPGGATPWASATPRGAAFFESAAAKADAPEPPATPAPAQPVTPQPQVFRGAYRRASNSSEFLPCGAGVALPVDGRGEALMLLRERWRWHATAVERPLYAVFEGVVLGDTGRAGGVTEPSARDSSASPRATMRFMLMRVDSLRAWRNGDCGQRHPPRW